MNIRTDIVQEFKNGDILSKILLINGALFVLLWVVEIFASITKPAIYGAVLRFFLPQPMGCCCSKNRGQLSHICFSTHHS